MNNLSPKYPTLTEAATGLGLNTSDLCAEQMMSFLEEEDCMSRGDGNAAINTNN